MSISQIKLEGFKSLTSNTFNFYPDTNKISAQNGVGKSSIADAIAFCYCGTDRYGNAKPLHVINKDSDGCKVTVTSDQGAEIVRTLSKKGNGTIKVIRNNVPNTLTQTQLSGLLGPQDVFLSATMLGYFMNLTPSKRKIVLKTIMPPLDLYKIVLDKTGQDIQGRYDLSKRSAADSISVDRRGLDKTLSQMEGSISTLREQVLPPKPEINPAVYEIKSGYEKQAGYWTTYNDNLKTYEETVNQINRLKGKNHELEQNAQAWRKELDELAILEEPQVLDKTSEINDLIGTKNPLPSSPSFIKEVQSERCPTCGTPVTRKMRDTVKATNDKLFMEYTSAKEAAEKHNKAIDEKVNALRSQYNMEVREASKIRELNQGNQRRKAQLESKLDNCSFHKIPDEPDKPVAPVGGLDEDSYREASKAIKGYEAALAIYENEVSKMGAADQKIADMSTELSKVRSDLESLRQVESVVKNLSNIILETHQQCFLIEGLDVVFSDGDLQIKRNGVPYTALSTGQKMRVDFALAQKINSLMERPVNLYFIDDSDLVDEVLVPEHSSQVFHTVVSPNQSNIEVSNDFLL